MTLLLEPDVLDSMQLTVDGRTYGYSPAHGFHFINTRGQPVATEKVPVLLRELVEHRKNLFIKIPIDDLAERKSLLILKRRLSARS